MTVRATLVVALALVVLVAGVPSPADAQITTRQVSRQFAKEYGVQVLKARTGKIDGKRVYLLTIMNPKGNFNEAFQVSTVAVDAKTGRLVSGFRHRADGRVSNQSPVYAPNRQPTESLSLGTTWR